MTRRTVAIAAAYIATIAAANWTTAHYGLIHLGPIAVTAGTALVGLSFVARDHLQDASRRRTVLAAIVAGAALSALLAPAQLAAASAVTFLAAELADMAVYTRLRHRTRVGAWIASNLAAAPIDSVLFLWLAGFPISGWTGQTAVKVSVGVATPLLIALITRRAHVSDLLRHRLHRAGA